MSHTEQVSYVEVSDPMTDTWIAQGRALTNVGLYVDHMTTDKTGDLKKRCQKGLDDGLFEGQAAANGSLLFMGQTWDFRQISKAVGK